MYIQAYLYGHKENRQKRRDISLREIAYYDFYILIKPRAALIYVEIFTYKLISTIYDETQAYKLNKS